MNSPVALDKGLNYSVDAVYVGASYPDADGIWRGTVYKLAIPITNGTYTEGPKASYELPHLAGQHLPTPWLFALLEHQPRKYKPLERFLFLLLELTQSRKKNN